MWIRKLFDIKHFEPGKWTVRDAMSVDGLEICFVAVAAESEDGVPDRSVGDIFPVERPIPISRKRCLATRVSGSGSSVRT